MHKLQSSIICEFFEKTAWAMTHHCDVIWVHFLKWGLLPDAHLGEGECPTSCKGGKGEIREPVLENGGEHAST